MKKTRLTKKRKTGSQNTQPDYIDCLTGDCFEGEQKTFIEPLCGECEPLSIPSMATREGQILNELARGVWVSNQSIYDAHGGHDGRKALSTLRKDHRILLEWEPVRPGAIERKHRIKPHCLDTVNRHIGGAWSQNTQQAAQAARTLAARAAQGAKRAARRKGAR